MVAAVSRFFISTNVSRGLVTSSGTNEKDHAFKRMVPEELTVEILKEFMVTSKFERSCFLTTNLLPGNKKGRKLRMSRTSISSYLF